MGIYLYFVFVTLCHALFLLKAKSIDENQSKRKLWLTHYTINAILWIILILWIVLIQFSSSKINYSLLTELLGFGVFLMGFLLAGISLSKLGINQAMGYRFFSAKKHDWISSGSYSFLHNPIYDGFVLVFIGLGLWRGIIIDFYLASISFLLLNVFLASVEKEKTQLELDELI